MPAPSATHHSNLAVRPGSHTRTTVNITDIYKTLAKTDAENRSFLKTSAIQLAQVQTQPRSASQASKYSGQNSSRAASRGSISQSQVGSRPATGKSNMMLSPSPVEPDEQLSSYQYDTFSQYATQSEPAYHQELTELDNTLSGVDYLQVEEYLPKRSFTSCSAPAHLVASRGFCPRAKSAIYSNPDQVNILSQQCCDVLGPKICHECAVIKRRTRDTRRYESFLPRVKITEENLATTLLIAKNYPHMTLEEIQMKLAGGHILKPVFKFNVQRMHERKQKEPQEIAPDQAAENYRPISLAASGPTYNYFSSVKDLDRKLTRGKLVRKIIITGDPKTDLRAQPPKRQDCETFSESVNPKFISPRRARVPKKRQLLFYDPPLLPKACQNVESFFAGNNETNSQ